jgi:hypothetical protein
MSNNFRSQIPFSFGLISIIFDIFSLLYDTVSLTDTGGEFQSTLNAVKVVEEDSRHGLSLAFMRLRGDQRTRLNCLLQDARQIQLLKPKGLAMPLTVNRDGRLIRGLSALFLVVAEFPTAMSGVLRRKHSEPRSMFLNPNVLHPNQRQNRYATSKSVLEVMIMA